MSCIIENPEKIAGEKAADYFGSGFHCAEAVAAAVLETLGQPSSEATAHATAFGGGFGKTFEEACGALSGSLIAIGHLHGRRASGMAWDLPAEMGAEIRTRFVEAFGTSNCLKLRIRFGEKAQMEECRKVVERTAQMLVGLLVEKG